MAHNNMRVTCSRFGMRASAVVARGQNVAERERHDQTRLLHPTRQLLVGTATINEQDLAGDEARPIRGEERNYVCDVVGPPSRCAHPRPGTTISV